MLKLFERNTGLQVIIILVVAVLLWIQPLAHPEPMPAPDGFAPLYSLIYHIGLSPLVAVIIAMLLVLLGGFFLNLIMTNVRRYRRFYGIISLLIQPRGDMQHRHSPHEEPRAQCDRDP